MIIKNSTQLASTKARKQLLRILEAGLEAIRTDKLMAEQFAYDERRDTLYINQKAYPLKGYKKVVVVGAGKMAVKVAEGIEAKMHKFAGARIKCRNFLTGLRIYHYICSPI